MRLQLTDEETAALSREVDRIIADDRYPLSPRITTLKAILSKLRPEPIREPLPQPKHLRAAALYPRTATAAVSSLGLILIVVIP